MPLAGLCRSDEWSGDGCTFGHPFLSGQHGGRQAGTCGAAHDQLLLCSRHALLGRYRGYGKTGERSRLAPQASGVPGRENLPPEPASFGAKRRPRLVLRSGFEDRFRSRELCALCLAWQVSFSLERRAGERHAFLFASGGRARRLRAPAHDLRQTFSAGAERRALCHRRRPGRCQNRAGCGS